MSLRSQSRAQVQTPFCEAQRRYTETFYISMASSLDDDDILRRDCSRLPTTNGTQKSNQGIIIGSANGERGIILNSGSSGAELS